MKYLILCFAAGFMLGMLVVYIWKRTHTIGVLAIYDMKDEPSPMVFLELEEEFHEFASKKTVGLRVEKRPYYEN